MATKQYERDANKRLKDAGLDKEQKKKKKKRALYNPAKFGIIPCFVCYGIILVPNINCDKRPKCQNCDGKYPYAIDVKSGKSKVVQ